MLGRIESTLRRWQRYLTPSEWWVGLFKLSRAVPPAGSRGLVLIQVDGLGYREIESALQRGEMPFLGSLLEREYYSLHPQYAGVPSTTPAYQGELFYGIKAVVPGFGFRHHRLQRLVRMYDPAAAGAVEADLRVRWEKSHPDALDGPLLTGGSCYSDNFSGGAAESHFCPATPGWGVALRERSKATQSLFLAWNLLTLGKTLILMGLELCLAIPDALRGVIDRRNFLRELLFIPTRVVIVILLRELVTLGVKMDIVRDLPVIHANFLGYDEQAHRRGPSSAFAHWTLRGIDHCIAGIWRAMHRSTHRHYDLWVYSDHGQETVLPYQQHARRSLAAAVADLTRRELNLDYPVVTSGHAGAQHLRSGLLGGWLFSRLLRDPGERSGEYFATQSRVEISALGPIAHLYYRPELSEAQLQRLARALVSAAAVPLVLKKLPRGGSGDPQATAWRGDGEFQLPEDNVRLLGSEHPYRRRAAADLAALCHHPDAGDLVLCGWRPDAQPLSFAQENGAHCGPGSRETQCFALLPADISLPATARNQLDAGTLHRLAMTFLHSPTKQLTRASMYRGRFAGISTPAPDCLRIMTYNVHGCLGMDGKVSIWRIARIIARYQPHVIALQELKVSREAKRRTDQIHLIAKQLRAEYRFHPSMRIAGGAYGNAVLSRLPLRLVQAAALPGLEHRAGLEPRAALSVEVLFGDITLQLINTHLGLLAGERYRQVEALLGEQWLGSGKPGMPAVLCGDFNLSPRSAAYGLIAQRLRDVQDILQEHNPRNTFPGRLPIRRIDHIFVSPGVDVRQVSVPDSKLIQLASDHLPVVVDLAL